VGLPDFASAPCQLATHPTIALPPRIRCGPAAAGRAGSSDRKEHSFFPSHFGTSGLRSIREERCRSFQFSFQEFFKFSRLHPAARATGPKPTDGESGEAIENFFKKTYSSEFNFHKVTFSVPSSVMVGLAAGPGRVTRGAIMPARA
jgi:hypothetical protein